MVSENLVDQPNNSDERMRQLLWRETSRNEIISRLNSGESMQQIIDLLDKSTKAEAFDINKEKVLVCADGRVEMNDDSQVKFGIAGAGVAFDLVDPLAYKQFVEFMKKAGITEVWSHDDCGAAQVVHGKGDTGDEKGRDFAERLANDLVVAAKHIIEEDDSGRTTPEMPIHLHHERMLCLDGTGYLNPQKLGLPSRFLMSSPSIDGYPEDKIRSELTTLLRDVTINHGFGQNFSVEEPMYIVVSARDAAQQQRFVALAEEVASELGEKLPIKIDSFIYNREKN